MLPPALLDAVRLAAMQAVKAYAPSHAEVAELRAMVYASARLSPDDVRCLELLLPAMSVFFPGRWVTTGELIEVAEQAPGEAGARLRQALTRFDGQKDVGKALGWLLRRAAGLPVNGLHILRLEPQHRRDSALHTVAGFSA